MTGAVELPTEVQAIRKFNFQNKIGFGASCEEHAITMNAFPLTLPRCTELCPIDKFIALTSNMRPENVQEECGLNPPSDPAVQRVTLLAALASTVMAATVLIAALLMICKGRGTSSSAASSA